MLICAVEKLLYLLLKLAILVMVWHEHDVLLEGIVTGWRNLRLSGVNRVHDGLRSLDLFKRHSLARVDDADERKLRVRLLEVDGISQLVLVLRDIQVKDVFIVSEHLLEHRIGQ